MAFKYLGAFMDLLSSKSDEVRTTVNQVTVYI